ncbi:serum response factor-like [Hydractinia symbiolongicarpus]|uniref:serum response factor-like n=1 Tax=Hydractinia symbiolongicarpus TaxID=13093 RepID=UPI00254A290E|nr:serum response factor-like [Hydractinia symbiolongicarpus]
MQNIGLAEYTSAGETIVVQQKSQLLNRSDGHNVQQQQSQRSFTQPLIVDETKQYMDGLVPEDENDTDEEMKVSKLSELEEAKKRGKKTRGRVKIKMEFIQNKLRRYTTFSKRKTGIMKKAYELSTLTGTQVMLLVASETGHVYTFATRKLQPMITSESGKALIQTCLNSPDPSPANALQQTVQQAQVPIMNPPPVVHNPSPPIQVTLSGASEQRMSQTGYEEPDLQYANSEDELKIVQSSSSGASIQYVGQSAQSFPVTTFITPASQGQSSKQVPVTYAVQPVGGITTIFSPNGVSSNSSSPAVQLQASQITQQPPPRILSGQLQLHRIHPQNIILTGNSPSLQSNHIILNPSASPSSSLVVANADEKHKMNATTHQQDVITLVNSDLSSTQPLQMVYNPGSGVLYAPQSGAFKRSSNQHETNADVVSLQHTPVIQTASLQPETSTAIINRGEGSTLLIRDNDHGRTAK